MADELNRMLSGDNHLEYEIVSPPASFYRNRPKITQMESLYLYNLGIVSKESFTQKFQKRLCNLIAK